jgi:hypothetical protein
MQENIGTIIKRMKKELQDSIKILKPSKAPVDRLRLSKVHQGKIRKMQQMLYQAYDRYGLPSPFDRKHQNVTTKFNKVPCPLDPRLKSSQSFVKTERFDFDRPLNFNPGPGTYLVNARQSLKNTHTFFQKNEPNKP